MHNVVKITPALAKQYWGTNQSFIINNLKDGHYGTALIDTSNLDFIAYILLQQNKFNHNEVSALYTMEPYRKQGYAKLLLNLFPNAQVLYTETTNTTARAMYEACGWIDSTILGYFGKTDKTKTKTWQLYYKPEKITRQELEPYEKGLTWNDIG